MAIFRKGILGGYSGKAGPITGTRWKTKDVVKINSKKKIKKKDLLPQSFALGTMSRFLKRFTAHINVGFYDRKNKMSPSNRAMKVNLPRAIKGESPDFEIDYEKVIFSKGNMETPWVDTVTREAETQIIITWEIPETLELKSVGNDIARILMYNVTRKQAVSFNYAAIRKDLSVTINLGKLYDDDEFHIWMFFSSADGKRVSDSEYVGLV